MEDNLRFELDTVASNGVLIVKDFDNTLSMAKEFCNSIPTFIITDDEQNKEVKEKRAEINKVVSLIDRKRIDTIEDFVSNFTNQCNEIKNVFDEKQKELGDAIKTYTDSKKAVVTEKTKVITATLKFYDEKIVDKVIYFCKSNNIELSIK